MHNECYTMHNICFIVHNICPIMYNTRQTQWMFPGIASSLDVSGQNSTGFSDSYRQVSQRIHPEVHSKGIWSPQGSDPPAFPYFASSAPPPTNLFGGKSTSEVDPRTKETSIKAGVSRAATKYRNPSSACCLKRKLFATTSEPRQDCSSTVGGHISANFTHFQIDHQAPLNCRPFTPRNRYGRHSPFPR